MAVEALVTYSGPPAVLRIAQPIYSQLLKIAFQRYPRFEWGTYAHFGWRLIGDRLVLTLKSLDPPGPGDLDDKVGHVAFQELYTLRQALEAEEKGHAVGVVHSHPRGGFPEPSKVDDDMDSYLVGYVRGFAPGRPVVSLILSEVDGERVISGRVWFRDRWSTIGRTLLVEERLETWPYGRRPLPPPPPPPRVARLASSYGDRAYHRLQASKVAVIGAGGTGSAAIPLLARAGVGHIVAIDDDVLTDSNLERVHGSSPEHASAKTPKVIVARELVHSIDASTRFTAVFGRLPQAEVLDAVADANVILGCTDQHSSRVALSDIATRYLIPTIDTGALMEGSGGHVTGQVGQLTRFLPADRCVYCRGMVDSVRVSQELMSPEERRQRREAADAALRDGRDPNPYWRQTPQINTVGHLTSVVGALAAGYAIGWITGAFVPPFERMQLDLCAPLLGTVECEPPRSGDCICRTAQGSADQGLDGAISTVPQHWPPARIL
jgi:molybdopterin/thiamine biosynthesis adenylyltransferase